MCCLGPDWHIKDGNCCPKSKAPKVSAFRAGTFVEIGIGFDGDGARIDAIHVLRADNATVEVAALQATADTSPVVSATKVDRSRPAVVELQVVDEYHRISTYAPVVTALQVPAGANQARETLTGLAPATCHLTVQNGAPGVTRLRIQLQGRRSQVVRLHDSELKTLRLPHGRAGKRALHLTALGRPGAAVLVIVGEQAQHQAVDWTGASPLSGQNLVWGSE